MEQSKLETLIKIKENNQELAGNSLKRLCIRHFIKDKSYLCKFAFKTKSNPMEALSKDLRSELMRAIFEQLNHFYNHEGPEALQLCNLLGLLVHDEVSTLELPQCDLNVRSNNIAMERLWQKVTKCTSGSLHCLTSSLTMNAETPFVQFFFKNVHTFKNLKELNVHYFSCDDQVFRLIAKHLPQLTYLSVALDKNNISEAGFRALSRLLHLRVLLFADFDRQNRHDDKELCQAMQCIELMPRLQLVGREFELVECMMGIYLFGYHNRLREFQSPVHFDLQELVLSGDGVCLPKSCEVPDVRRLHLYLPSVDLMGPLLRQMSQVTELGLWKVSNDAMSQVLAKLGARLEKLSVLSTDQVQLGSIFKFCPRLSELRIVQTDLATGCTPWPPSSTFARLRLLELTQESGKYGLLPRGFLQHVLTSAPLLEHVRLASFWLTSDDVGQLQQQLMNKTVLQRLQKFECETKNTELSEMLQKYVMAFCPLSKELAILQLMPSSLRFDSYMIKTMRHFGIF